METLTRLPWAAKSAVFRRLEEIADVSELSREERIKYDEGLRKYRDTIGVLQGALMEGDTKGFKRGLKQGEAKGLKRGREEGLKQGIAEGEARSKKMLAKVMLSKGYDANVIFDLTGLSLDDIQ